MGGPGSGGPRKRNGAALANETRHNHNHPLHPRMIKARELDVRALELRKAGGSYRAIGAALGIKPQAALNCCKRALKELLQQRTDDAGALREVELGRLDIMLTGIWNKAASGDVPAVRAALEIVKSRRELLGLDAPKAFTADVGVSADADVHMYWPDNGRGPKPGG